MMMEKIYKVIKFATDISEQVKKDQEKLRLISELAEKMIILLKMEIV